jgi:hypothetical protein
MQCRIQPGRERYYHMRLSYYIVSADMAGLFDSVSTGRGVAHHENIRGALELRGIA